MLTINESEYVQCNLGLIQNYLLCLKYRDMVWKYVIHMNTSAGIYMYISIIS